MLNALFSFISRFLKRERRLSLGLYGKPNVGKTTLANKICADLAGEKIGIASPIPHETRTVWRKNGVKLSFNGKKMNLEILDMPGIADRIDYRDLLLYGLDEESAKSRAADAAKGVAEAMGWIGKLDAALVVVDCADGNPNNQVNMTVIKSLELSGKPIILVANKIDMRSANITRVKETFPEYPIVEVSALTGKNITNLYEAISTRLTS